MLNYQFEDDYKKLINYVKKHPNEKIICVFKISDEENGFDRIDFNELAYFQFNEGCFNLKRNRADSFIFTKNEDELLRKCKRLKVKYLMSDSMLNEFVYN